MAPRKQFAWNSEKEEKLLECFALAKVSHDNKKTHVRIHELFLAAYPECKLAPSTLHKYARDMEKQRGGRITNNKTETFQFDERKEAALLELLTQIRQQTSDRGIEERLHEEFLKMFPTCHLKPSTLRIYANSLETKRKDSLVPSSPKDAVWDSEKDDYLLGCAQKAHELNIGKEEKMFQETLWDLFKEKYPEINEQYAIRHFYELKNKLNIDFDNIPENEHLKINMIMWERGFKMSITPLFECCCFYCSVLILHTSATHRLKTIKNPREIPVTEMYPENDLQEKYKKNDNQFYVCSLCKGGPMFQYQLAPDGVKILPIPQEIKRISRYEKQQIGLVGLHSTTHKYKSTERAVYEHKQGEVNAMRKGDDHYLQMYVMIMQKPGDDVPKVEERSVREALRWLKANNPLYREHFANYETLYRYMPPRADGPVNIKIFDEGQVISVETEKPTVADVLEDEARGMLIPNEDLKAKGSAPLIDTVTALKHTRSIEEARRQIKKAVQVRFGDGKLLELTFPTLFLYGTGGWNRGTYMTHATYMKFRLMFADDRFRRDPDFMFFNLDRMLKERIQYYNHAKVQVKELTEPITKADVNEAKNVFDQFGTEVPYTIPNSKNYWWTKTQELIALSAYKGREPDFFITLTHNDGWPELQAVVKDGIWGKEGRTDKQDLPAQEGCEKTINYPVEATLAFYRRFQHFTDVILRDPNGIFGEVEDVFTRMEYQNRGAVHAHLVIWVKEGTKPDNVVTAEMPRFDHEHNDRWREMVRTYQKHGNCRDKCKENRRRTVKYSRCKYGFPFQKCKEEKIDEVGTRWLYPRSEDEDLDVVPYNLALLMFWNAHVNVQRVTPCGWEMYLAKYVAKAAVAVRMGLKQEREGTKVTDVQRYLTTRVVSSMECATLLLQKPHVYRSRNVIFLPIEFDPQVRFLKRKRDLVLDDPDSEDVYYDNKLEKYLDRPDELADLTYPEFYAAYYYGCSTRRENEASFDSDEDEDDDDRASTTSSRRPKAVLKDKKGRTLVKRVMKEAVPYFRHYCPYGSQLESYCLVKLLQNKSFTRESLQQLKEQAGSYMQACIDNNLLDAKEDAMNFLEGAAKRGVTVATLMDMARELIAGNWLEDQDLAALLETVAPGHQNIENEVKKLLAEEDVDARDLDALKPLKEYLAVDEYASKFSESQKAAFEYITSRWCRNERVRTMVAGEAGSGKSFLLDALVAFCRENDKTVAILATTGCAAYHIGGRTIHSYFRLDHELKSFLEPRTFAHRLVRDVQVILIDEVSMLQDELLRTIDQTLREATNAAAPYANKSVIMFGDPCQLPPVGNHMWFWELYRRFDTMVLRQNMRVNAEEKEFVQLLNRVRVGHHTKEDLRTLQERVVSEKDVEKLDLSKGVYLVPTRRRKSELDGAYLAGLTGTAVEYAARDLNAAGQPVQEELGRFINSIEYPANLLPTTIQLKVGAKAMLIRNKYVECGWVNGRICVVEMLRNDSIVVHTVEDEKNKLVLTRHKEKITWPGCTVECYRHQFPLQLSFAVTIHKAQGQTLDKVVVQAAKLKCSGQFYTAISRVRRCQDLHFTALEPGCIYVHHTIVLLMDWMDKVDVLKGFKGNYDNLCMPKVQLPPARIWGEKLHFKPKQGAAELADILSQDDRQSDLARIFADSFDETESAPAEPKDGADKGVAAAPPQKKVDAAADPTGKPKSGAAKKAKPPQKKADVKKAPKRPLVADGTESAVPRKKPNAFTEKRNEPKAVADRGECEFAESPYEGNVDDLKINSVKPSPNAQQLAKLLGAIRDLSTKTDVVFYTQKLLKLTNAAGIPAFLKKVREAKRVLFRQNMKIDGDLQKRTYAAMRDQAAVVKTQGDGSCLFRAFARSLFGDESAHLLMRAMTCHVFAEYFKYFQVFLPTDGEYADVQRLIQATTRYKDNVSWGSACHLKAIAIAANREVFVYLARGDKDKFVDAPRDLLETEIKDVSMGNLRYVPMQRGPWLPPLMALLSDAGTNAAHYSTLLLRTADSWFLQLRARGDLVMKRKEAAKIEAIKRKADITSNAPALPPKRAKPAPKLPSEVESTKDLESFLEQYGVYGRTYVRLRNAIIDKADFLTLTRIQPTQRMRDRGHISAGWLADVVIEAYLHRLAETQAHLCPQDCIAYQQVQAGRGIPHLDRQLANKTHFAMPFNVHGNHWTLLAVRLDVWEYYHLNSMGAELKPDAMTQQAVDRVLGLLPAPPNGPWSYVPVPRVRQTDMYNCGVFVCYFAQQFAQNRPFDAKFDEDAFRVAIFKSIAGPCMHRVRYDNANCRVCQADCNAEYRECAICNHRIHDRCAPAGNDADVTCRSVLP